MISHISKQAKYSICLYKNNNKQTNKTTTTTTTMDDTMNTAKTIYVSQTNYYFIIKTSKLPNGYAAY